MRSFQKIMVAALALFAPLAASAAIEKRGISSMVHGSPMGFASSVTGGGNAAPVYPSTTAQLIAYLTSDEPQNIYISGTFNFAGTEGTTSVKVCDAYNCNPSNGGQALMNTLGGCGPRPTYNVNIDTAAYKYINVKSNKTLIGRNKVTLNGKGLRFVGSSNIIIQNIAITNLNPKYVWGGDALIFSDSKNIWIDHVTTSKFGRQHYSFGTGASKGITISNSFLDGRTTQSATCNGHTYWGIELIGSGDQITFYKNHVYYTSGRTPALSGDTLFHAVNNVWSSNTGHMIEGGDRGKGIFEGNHFVNNPIVVIDNYGGKLFTSDPLQVSKCKAYLGRQCVSNTLSNSGPFRGDTIDVLSGLKGRKDVVVPASALSISNTVPSTAGYTL